MQSTFPPATTRPEEFPTMAHPTLSSAERDRALAEFSDGPELDVLVVGGGITGETHVGGEAGEFLRGDLAILHQLHDGHRRAAKLGYYTVGSGEHVGALDLVVGRTK